MSDITGLHGTVATPMASYTRGGGFLMIALAALITNIRYDKAAASNNKNLLRLSVRESNNSDEQIEATIQEFVLVVHQTTKLNCTACHHQVGHSTRRSDDKYAACSMTNKQAGSCSRGRRGT